MSGNKLFYAGVFLGTALIIIIFPLLAFLAQKSGFILPLSHFMSRFFPGVIAFSRGSFSPVLYETFFSIGYLCISLFAAFVALTGFYNLDGSEACKKWYYTVNKNKNSNVFYALLLFSFCELSLIVSNTEYFGNSFSFSVFTGYGLSVNEVGRSMIAPYVSSLYNSRLGLAFSGTFILLTGWVSIILVPLFYRAYRCVIISFLSR